MSFPTVTLEQWRAQVEKELAGKAFDKVLVQEVLEGLQVAPLYTQGPSAAQLVRDPPAGAFRLCMRWVPQDGADALEADLEGGAEALWLRGDALPPRGQARAAEAGLGFLLDCPASPTDVERQLSALPVAARERVALNVDPVGAWASGGGGDLALDAGLAALGPISRRLSEGLAPKATAVMVSTLPFHEAGADAVEELACALSTARRYLEALLDAGLSMDAAARQLAFQVAVGRDTFLELCKLRALRTCARKLFVAAGAPQGPRHLVHAVCSRQTLAVRDPWVNMLRVTTQLFAAILGGADWVTPNAFDEGVGRSSLGRRVARNTGLVLRDESLLGKVADAAGGSYFFEALTDALARKAWQRFQSLEADGGIVAALRSGRLAERLDKSWRERQRRLDQRKLPLLGVSEFANLDEALPFRVPDAAAPARPALALPRRREASSFEALRSRADAAVSKPEVLLVTLGPLTESRARVGFATSLFASGGLRAKETQTDELAPLVCLCGSDERYAEEVVSRARALKALGCERVLLAGRPGAHEREWRAAGVDDFIFLGCDVPAVLSGLLERFS